ncbi:hypothetical protein ABZ760_14845 [Streptomyces sp. NPDC006658]|uniref:hypothetical protein n=1 Tax=Streptomyces sp. NPDC006658 TaxID=3156900 RepID=UPI0033F6435F
MPRTTRPREHGPGTPSPPGYFAEQALLGALLSEPHRLPDLTGISPCQLVIGSRRAVAELTAIRTRWQQATSPATGPSPRTTPAARRTGPAPISTAPVSRLTRWPNHPGGRNRTGPGHRAERAPRVTEPALDAHVCLDTYPTLPSAVIAIVTGSQAHIAVTALEADGWETATDITLVLARIDHEEPYWANQTARQLNDAGITIEISGPLRKAIDEEWA